MIITSIGITRVVDPGYLDEESTAVVADGETVCTFRLDAGLWRVFLIPRRELRMRSRFIDDDLDGFFFSICA